MVTDVLIEDILDLNYLLDPTDITPQTIQARLVQVQAQQKSALFALAPQCIRAIALMLRHLTNSNVTNFIYHKLFTFAHTLGSKWAVVHPLYKALKTDKLNMQLAAKPLFNAVFLAYLSLANILKDSRR